MASSNNISPDTNMNTGADIDTRTPADASARTAADAGTAADAFEISIDNLTFTHRTASTPALAGISLHLPKGSRTVLVGANGAGKSTLLQILAGKRLVNAPDARVYIQGRDVFRDSPRGVTFLGTEWAMNAVVRGDIEVSAFLDSVGGYRHAARRDALLDLLDVDTSWHMHAVSDGERRRVQLVMGLMAPWDVLLLDEVTVDLDVQVRADLIAFLKEDAEKRGATIVYATHIFDGLDAFPTHVAHMAFGAFETAPTPWPEGDGKTLPGRTLYELALRWLREDRARRRALEDAGGLKPRGPRRDGAPTDSEIFYKRYDYSH